MQDALDRLSALAAHPVVARLAEAFADAGAELAVVGGPVRDALLGTEAHDFDFTTNLRPDDILSVIKPIVETHWDIGREFGTIGAVVAGETVEITTYRSDAYDGVSRKPEVRFGDTLEGDLVRRDFTVNALAFRVPDRVLVDPANGIEDLIAGRLRTPQTAEQSFDDDPLRMMRAVRFASQLGFEPGSDVIAALRAMSGRIAEISVERVRDEFSKLMLTDEPRAGLEIFCDTGLADYVFPELPGLRLEIDEHARHKDILEHTLTVVDQAIELEKLRHPGEPPHLINRLAALCHDIGKPATKRVERGGVVTFYGHDVVGARMTKKRLRALRFDNDTIAKVARLVELHLRFFGYTEAGWTDAAVRRYVRDAGDLLEELHILTRADVTTRNRAKASRLHSAYDGLEQRIAQLREQEELDAVRPDLDGDAIMRILGLKPGREVGIARAFLLERRLERGPVEPDAAQAELIEWWRSEHPDWQPPAG